MFENEGITSDVCCGANQLHSYDYYYPIDDIIKYINLLKFFI